MGTLFGAYATFQNLACSVLKVLKISSFVECRFAGVKASLISTFIVHIENKSCQIELGDLRFAAGFAARRLWVVRLLHS